VFLDEGRKGSFHIRKLAQDGVGVKTIIRRIVE
jgi:hypothetical protein